MKRPFEYTVGYAPGFSKRARFYTPAARPYSNLLRAQIKRGMRPPVRQIGYTRTGGFIPEKKFFDTALAFSIDTTGEVPATGQLCLIPQGDTESTRDGRSCVIKSIQLKMNLGYVPSAAANASGVMIIYLVQDMQTNGAAAAVTDVFTGTDPTIAMVNMANSKRFKILKKFVRAFNSQAGVTTAYNTVHMHIDYFKKCAIELEFSSTTGAITELKSNNVFLIAQATVGIDDLVTVSGNCRLRFRG